MWKLKLVNNVGLVVAEEWTNEEIVTTKMIGELDWVLSEGDQLILEKMD